MGGCRACGLPQWLSGKESSRSAGATGDVGSIPGLGRSLGGGKSNPLHYPCLENPTEEPGGLQSLQLERAGHD